MIKCWSNVGQTTPTSKIFGHHIWQQIIAGTGLARPTNPLGAPSCPKLASRELLGYWGDAGKMGKGWKIGVSQKPVGYLCVSVCHGLSSCKFGTTLCDIIQLGSSGVVGLHCQNSSLESGCVCSGFVVPIAPILLVSMGNGPLHSCRTGL